MEEIHKILWNHLRNFTIGGEFSCLDSPPYYKIVDLDLDMSSLLLSEITTLTTWKCGAFSSQKTIDSSIRSDEVVFLKSTNINHCPILQKYCTVMNQLQKQLNSTSSVHLSKFEIQVSLYRNGKKYQRHYDSTPFSTSQRRVTCILYLNKDWKIDDGGELRLHFGDTHIDVSPIANRFILFNSTQVEHEVMHVKQTANKYRYAITTWFSVEH